MVLSSSIVSVTPSPVPSPSVISSLFSPSIRVGFSPVTSPFGFITESISITGISNLRVAWSSVCLSTTAWIYLYVLLILSAAALTFAFITLIAPAKSKYDVLGSRALISLVVDASSVA